MDQTSEVVGQEVAVEAKTWRFDAGKSDPTSVQEYMQTLPPAETARILDIMVTRATEVVFEPGEKERIVSDVLSRDRHTTKAEPVPGLQLTIQSFDEDDYQFVIAKEIGETDTESPKAQRRRQLRMIHRGVTHIGGDPLPADLEKREKYWRSKSPHLLDRVGECVSAFNQKVRAALLDAEVVGKS